MEGLELICFEMIATNGSARSYFLEALEAAKKGDFVEAEKLMEEGDKMLVEGHYAHGRLLEQEAGQHAYFGSGLDVLEWPVFKGNYDRRWIEALIFDPTLPCDDGHGPCTSPRVTDDSIRDKFDDPRQSSGTGVGIREDDVPHLMEIFLANVHVKNPIFDPAYLRKMAKSVAEHGFDWKAPSCLVVCTYHLSPLVC